MTTVYVGDIGTEIILDCGTDISSATVRKINARKPDGTTLQWLADADGTTSIKYVTVDGDLSAAGLWLLQAYIEMPGWKGRGETARMPVADSFAS